MIRAAEWWEHKLSPMLATVYATAYLLHLPMVSLWPVLAVGLFAIVPGAAYVSIINDLTDREEDAAAGKINRLAGRSAVVCAVWLIGCIVPGVLMAVQWRRDPLLLWLYLAAWVAFSLYSIPPIRLKHRGLAGIVADASGAHMLPTLVFVVLTFRAAAQPPDRLWLIAVGVWALCNGLRGILWHQLGDRDYDVASGAGTFVARRDPMTVVNGATFGLFPVELAAFAVLLWRAAAPAAWLFLLLYVSLLWRRHQRRRLPLTIVAPRPRSRIAMYEYYELFFPVAILLASSLRHPTDVMVLVAHLVLFPGRALNLWEEHAPRLIATRH